MTSADRSNRTLAAAGAIVLYAVLIGYIDNYVRVIAEGTGLWQFQAMRSAMVLVIVAAVMALPFVPRLKVVAPGAVLARAVVQSVALFIYFGSLGFLSVAQAAAGLFTAPIFVLLIGRLVYGHRIGAWRIVAALVGFAGVVMVLSPDPAALGPASLVPVAGGALYALANIATREWCGRESAATLVVSYMLVMGVLAAVVLAGLWWLAPDAPQGAAGFLTRGPAVPSAEVLFWTAVQAVGSLVAVGLMVRAYQLAEASRVSVLEYVVLPFSALWAWVIWGETIGPVAAVGMAIIIASGIAMGWRGRAE
ncbi:MAG: DMT family transporter [Rhodobacterales bacterium]|nr:DMT family transporter [Rhodobacterales bacterium]MDX5501176.1 DMT family transporter [Rhodobacterales bacterium]